MTITVPICSSIGGGNASDRCRWTVFSDGRTYECKALIVREDEGFSAHATDLPGVVSQGETVEAALQNIGEAFQGVVQEYLATTGVIPWSKVDVEGEVECERRILVNV